MDVQKEMERRLRPLLSLDAHPPETRVIFVPAPLLVETCVFMLELGAHCAREEIRAKLNQSEASEKVSMAKFKKEMLKIFAPVSNSLT